MSAAATQRADRVIGEVLWTSLDATRALNDQNRVVQIAEDCNQFVRQVMDYLIEPRGLRQNSIERAKTRRGWNGRQIALTNAHNAWVDVDFHSSNAYHCACIKRAQAAYKLFVYALGTWTIPAHIAVPRAAAAN